ncbi:hypothetical protein JL722_13431 [Aureococcus anophagefferens]|nr:hypothetical protein JL722_13431 [Aureococcus anophagefferens]
MNLFAAGRRGSIAMNLMLLSLCMYRAAPDETDARRLALHVQRSHTAPHVHPRGGADAAAAESSAAPAFLGPAIDASPTAAAARPINVSNSSGEAAFRRWWADGRHLSSADAFEHATIADAGAKYAAVLFGMVRTWSMSRKMFQRTFLGPNGPMDLFFEVYARTRPRWTSSRRRSSGSRGAASTWSAGARRSWSGSGRTTA